MKSSKKKSAGYNTRQATAMAKQIVTENLKHMENPCVSDIVTLIKPLYIFDEDALKEQELKRKARYIMSTFRDSKKIRIYFSNSEGVYINVDRSTDLVDLSKVNKQLYVKYSGLTSAMNKVHAKMTKIVGRFGKNRRKQI